MRKYKLNNKGMTLIEMTVCFVILGALLVVATQIIRYTSNVYYDTKTNSFGIQASQIVATELKVEIEDAIPKYLLGTSNYIKIDNINKSIEFIGQNGSQVKYILEENFTDSDNNVLKKYESDAYTLERLEPVSDTVNTPNYYSVSPKIFDSKYIGMGYVVKDISFKYPFEDGFVLPNQSGENALHISNYPILKMTITVGNNQYGNYECEEYIPLYNFYGIDLDATSIVTNVIVG